MADPEANFVVAMIIAGIVLVICRLIFRTTLYAAIGVAMIVYEIVWIFQTQTTGGYPNSQVAAVDFVTSVIVLIIGICFLVAGRRQGKKPNSKSR